MDRIFVQIASYRDPECQWTIRDLFAKAKHPARITVGVCVQYDAVLEPECGLPEPTPGEIRSVHVDWRESRGVCWARAQTQKLYHGEDFTLMIDSHMRFVPEWDERMLAELARCPSSKPLLSNHPSPYVPPDQYDTAMLPTTLCVDPFARDGSIRIRGKPRSEPVADPTLGAYAAAGFIFARATLIAEIPYDPFLYFSQEEISLAARLYTTGWDIFSPSCVLLFHYYTPVNATDHRRMHWDDHADWDLHNRRAQERVNHLLGMKHSENPEAIRDLQRYGLGTVRGLSEFERFSGLSFKYRQISPQSHTRELGTNRQVGETRNLMEYRRQNATNSSLDIDETQPPGLLIVRNYLDATQCEKFRRFAEIQDSQEMEVVDGAASTECGFVTAKNPGRIGRIVAIDGISEDVLGVFDDIYTKVLAPWFEINFEWYERPQILRYDIGGRYDVHSDSEDWIPETEEWMRLHDRDYSVLLYLNDDYDGGELHFCEQELTIKPQTGLLVAFPSDHRYRHTALPTSAGVRFVMVSWSAEMGSGRVRAEPPWGSVFMSKEMRSRAD